MVEVQFAYGASTVWLKETVDGLTGFREIEVDSHGRTNVPGVFAAGDGAKAALSAFDHLIRTTASV